MSPKSKADSVVEESTIYSTLQHHTKTYTALQVLLVVVNASSIALCITLPGLTSLPPQSSAKLRLSG